MTNQVAPKELWKERSVAETLEIYKNWSGNYDGDVTGWGYATPKRLAVALRQAGANPAKPLLDFGCGTGISGLALKSAGFDVIDGVDISAEMLQSAADKGVYRQVWLGQPGSMGHIGRGDYPIIAAVGVVSLGAAPPETLDMLVNVLGPAGLLAFSYNDATLAAATYTDKLAAILADGDVEIMYEEHGPHLPGKDMNSTIYVLQKT